MGAVLLVISCVYILTFALMATAQRADDATDLIPFDAGFLPPYRIEYGRGDGPVISPRPTLPRFDVVSVP